MTGRYLVGRSCRNCPLGTETCHLDQSNLDLEVDTFWNSHLTTLQSLRDPTTLPTFSTSTEVETISWMNSYIFAQYFIEVDNGATAEELIAEKFLNFYTFLINNPSANRNFTILTTQINLILGKALTSTFVSSKYGEMIQRYVISDTCADTYFINSTDNTCGRCSGECIECT